MSALDCLGVTGKTFPFLDNWLNINSDTSSAYIFKDKGGWWMHVLSEWLDVVQYLT